MKRARRPLSYFQQIFANAKVNGGYYAGDELPRMIWRWPTGTYLERRLQTRRQGERQGQGETRRQGC